MEVLLCKMLSPTPPTPPPPVPNPLNKRGVHSRVWGSESGTGHRASQVTEESPGAEVGLSHLQDERIAMTFLLRTGSVCSVVGAQQPQPTAG